MVSSLSASPLSPLPAYAQDNAPGQNIDTQLFLPTTSTGLTFTLPETTLLRHLSFEVGLASSFALRPFVRAQDGVAEDITAWTSQNELLFAIGLFEWMELGIAAPLVVARTSNDLLAETQDLSTIVRAGDTRLSLKVPILRGDFSLMGQLLVSLPSGDGERAHGAGYWSTAPSMVVSYTRGDFSFVGEAGYRFRKKNVIGNLLYDDEVFFGAGGKYQFIPALAAIAETQIRLGVLGGLSKNEMPMDINAGLRWSIGKHVVLDFGVGTGIIAGYGAPDVRGFAMLRYASDRTRCVEGPEDYDGFQDGDFCADLDNDGDGLTDSLDQCPNNAEDIDGFQDEDGCPDLDNDGDGIPDLQDKCPEASEDMDGFEDEDGCPDLDNDGDGIPDGLDLCPMEPEDFDRFEDEDGCPEPGPKQAVITVTDTRILISERIYFDFDRDTIRAVSIPLLQRVADVIRDLPKDRAVRIEGYTDTNGDPEYNRDLSYRRARSVVEYLVSHGVERDRLDYIGYGPDHPVAPDDTPEGAALNRRVEFTIMQRGALKSMSKGNTAPRGGASPSKARKKRRK